MSRPAQPVRYTVVGVSVVYAVVLQLAGLRLDTPLKQALTFLPAVAAGILVAWDLLLWRLPGFARLTKRPRLDGLWRVELHPTAESRIPPEGNHGPIAAYLVITQTSWSIAVRQYTGESTSDSRAHYWQRSPGAAVETLAFLYDNTPEQRHQDRSPRHLGTCLLDPASKAPREMAGWYFTDRYTKGDMTLELVDRSTGHPSFASAHAYRPRPVRGACD